ncbi:MAG: hypothetical protein RSC00_06620, partial [Ruthenibacterium sp.]
MKNDTNVTKCFKVLTNFVHMCPVYYEISVRQNVRPFMPQRVNRKKLEFTDTAFFLQGAERRRAVALCYVAQSLNALTRKHAALSGEACANSKLFDTDPSVSTERMGGAGAKKS